MKKKKLIDVFVVGSLLLLIYSIEVEAGQYGSGGIVEFSPNRERVDPVDPENPDPNNPVKPVNPIDPDKPDWGTQGPLSIDYASNFDFGTHRISNEDQIYFARAQTYQENHRDTPNFVQITDNRGTNNGWILTVKQESQFQATTDTKYAILTGAEIRLESPVVNSNVKDIKSPLPINHIVLVPGTEVLVTKAENESGAGTWVTYWGKVESVDEQDAQGENHSENVTKAIQLFVPGETPKDAVKYQTKLEWKLIDAVGN